MAPSVLKYYLAFMALTVMSINMNMNMMMCSAEQHVVGDDRGWDPASDVEGWTSHKIFRVGDNLWFAYATSKQNVLELKSKEEYENCDVSNPIKIFDGGLDAVPLIETGERYFTSGNAESCQRGMKVHVNVVSDGLDNGRSDNFDVVSDGLDKVRKDFGLDLLSDGVDHYVAASAGDDSMEEVIMEGVAEGPTSSRRQLSRCPPSVLINLTISICGPFIIMFIYAMV